MRKALGISFILLGAIGLSICGIVLLHLWPPIPGFLLRRVGTWSIMVDPLEAPIWATLFLAIGIVLVSRRMKGLRIVAITIGAIDAIFLVAISLMPDWMIVGIRLRWPWK